MVNLVEDWEVLEEYAGDKRGFYQILYGAKGVEYGLNISKVSENALKEMMRRLETTTVPKEPRDCPDNPQNNV